MQMALPLYVIDPSVTCAFGTPSWPHDECAGCRDYADELHRQFEADVAAGIYDAEGYTPAERKRQRQRRR